jgi:hypothetical protein
MAAAKPWIPAAHRVLAKPCDAAELEAVIESFCTLQDVFCTPSPRPITFRVFVPAPSIPLSFFEDSNTMPNEQR